MQAGEAEVKYPPWVREILRRIRVTIYRGKNKQVLKENVPILDLPSKLLSSGRSRLEQKAFVVGFEDEEEIWNECSDIVVKIYDLKGQRKHRVEIFCSGVNKKEIWFDGELVLRYDGYNLEDIKEKKQIVGTVIFDK